MADSHGITDVLDFLDDLYRAFHPPLRDIAKYGQFVLREPQLPRVPGVELSLGGDQWLSARLVPVPPPPQVPEDLQRWVQRERLSPNVRPSLELPADFTEEDFAAADKVEQWAAKEWQPWAEKCIEVEKSRSFYKRLFALRAELEQHRDSRELLVGFGRIRWMTDNGQIDHPMVTQEVDIRLESNGELTVVPDGVADVEHVYLSDVHLADRTGFHAYRKTSPAEDVDLWSRDSRRALIEDLLRRIDHDGVWEAEGDASPQAANAARVRDEWVLFVRPRPTDFYAFTQRQRELYEGGTPPSAPFTAILGAPDAGDTRHEGGNGAPEGEERSDPGVHTLFLPKPANEEQERILRLAITRPGVTAQGPPGTGKSHTIANLVSHFVADGKRVLVTSEREQALRVVSHLLPPAVRELSVAVLGSDDVSRAGLEQAIARIDQKVSTFDEASALRDIARLEGELSRIHEERAKTANDLRDARAAETLVVRGVFEAGTDPSPQVVAQWLRESADACGFIPDDVALAVRFPLAGEQWVELVDLAKSLSPDDTHASTLPMPPESVLRSGAELHSLCEELRTLRTRLADVEDEIADWQQVDGVEPSRMRLLQARLSDALEWRQQIQHTWLEVVRREAADAVTGREWSTFVAEVEREREAAIAARRQTASYSVKVPATWDLVFMQGLHSARERFAQGKGVSALLQRSAWKALEQCRVDGRVPSTTRELSVCFAALDRVEAQRRLRNRWANDMRRVGAPALDGDRAPEDAVAEYLGHLRMAVTWDREHWPQLTAELRQVGVRSPSASTIGALEKTVRVVGQLVERPREREITGDLEDLEGLLKSGVKPGASTLWIGLLESLRNKHWDRWDGVVLEQRRLGSVSARARRYLELSATLRGVAPEFARDFLHTRGQGALQYSQLLRAWEWRQLESWLNKRNAGESPAALQGRLRSLTDRRHRVMEELVATRALLGLQRGFTQRKRQALNRYLIAARRYGKTGGKFAARWLREIRDALDESKDAVPVWIMPIGRVLSSFRPDKTPPFDVVIIDEASQSGLSRLPVLALGSKAIVVGDDKQTSPENVGQGREVIFALIDQHLGGLRHARTLFDPDNSLYDVAKQRFPDVVSLVEHFRCLPAIIGFSQRYYGNLIPLRDRAPSPHWVAARTVFVPNGYRDERDVNEPEARTIVELVSAAHRDPAYDGMTFGVISLLGQYQAPRIRELLLEALGPEVVEARRLRCGEPSDFQGDERDVVFLSLVIDANRKGTMSGLNPARRMNVAASRARNQLVIAHSVKIEDLASQDERRALLEYFSNPQASGTLYANLEQRCESDFEKDVLRAILNRGYRRVIPQYEVARKRIDLVVEGPTARLAVECDGDQWHGPEQWEDDRRRQAMLERAGWTFERIRGSSFYRDPMKALEPLWTRLDELGVPTGDWVCDVGPGQGEVAQISVAVTAPQEPEEDPLGPVVGLGERGVESAQVEVKTRESAVPQQAPRAVTTDHMSPDAEVHREIQVSLAVHPAIMRPYSTWSPRKVTVLEEGAGSRVMVELEEIVRTEGPIRAQRLVRLHYRAAGGRRVSSRSLEAYQRCLDRLLGRAVLSAVVEGHGEFKDRTIVLAGQTLVDVRQLGPRSLFEVPPSEILAVHNQLGLKDASTGEAMRALLTAYGLKRLTEKAEEYLRGVLGRAKSG